jgi:hypothetical protein
MITEKIVRWSDDSILSREWRNEKGETHNPNGPAYLYYGSKGSIIKESWYFHGKLHRLDGPAVSLWHNDGYLIQEIWYVDGVKSREDGPASVTYNSNGAVLTCYYYYRGLEYSNTNMNPQKWKSVMDNLVIEEVMGQ